MLLDAVVARQIAEIMYKRAALTAIVLARADPTDSKARNEAFDAADDYYDATEDLLDDLRRRLLLSPRLKFVK